MAIGKAKVANFSLFGKITLYVRRHYREDPPSLRVERQPALEVKPISFRMLIDKGELPLYEEVGPKYDVRVITVSEEGREYTHYSEDERHRPHSYTGKVPEGKIYGEVSSSHRDLSDFWKEFREKEQTSKAAS